MRRRREFAATIALAFTTACSAPLATFEPCIGADTIALGAPAHEPLRSIRILADDNGWIVFWARHTIDQRDEDGVLATRPGGAPTRFVAESAAGMEVARVANGFLVCWWSGSSVLSLASLVKCTVFDDQLVATTAALTVKRAREVLGFPQLGGRLYALFRDYDAPIKPDPWLVPIDENGDPRGSGVSLSCVPSAWNSDVLACLVPNDPACDAPIRPPSGCDDYLLRLLDAKGVPLRSDVRVAPFASGSEPLAPRLAARQDGFLVTWFDGTGIHAQPVSPDGVIGTLVDLAVPGGFPGYPPLPYVASAPWGYVLAWDPGAHSDGPSVATMVNFAADGTPLGEPHPIGDPHDFDTHESISFGTARRGLAAAWSATKPPKSDWALLFRAVGCEP